MDLNKLVEAFAQTTNAEMSIRQAGEKYLDDVYKIAGFVPALLQIAMSPDIEPPVRQAAVVHMKNQICRYWEDPVVDAETAVMQYSIIEQDRHIIREHIIDALEHAADPLRPQLATCIETIGRRDFPTNWPSLTDQIITRLQKPDANAWLAALTAIYRLVKCYEYRKAKEKEPMWSLMRHFLPELYTRLQSLMTDASNESVLLQKLILKIFYALTQHSLNVKVMHKEQVVEWLELCRQIIARPANLQTDDSALDDDEREQLVQWKCKKWAVLILQRVLERYATPGQTAPAYADLAKYYASMCSVRVLETVMGVLDTYRRQEYVSGRVLHRALCFVQLAVSHSLTWRHVKPHAGAIVRDIILPLMKHTEEDEELWTDDAKEYIHQKFDAYNELLSPASAAAALLTSIVKRARMLDSTVTFLVEILNKESATPVDIDAALHMCGEIAPSLIKNAKYRPQLENLLMAQVVPRITSEQRFLRARACWVVMQFASAPWHSIDNMRVTIDELAKATMEDKELPVKVEAALALQMILAEQPKAEDILRGHIRRLVIAILELISHTEQDDLTSVMDQLINRYLDEIVPIAVEVAQGLANVFCTFLMSEEFNEDRTVTAMGIMGTLENIISVMEDHKEIMVHLEAIVLNVIQVVMTHAHLDFYEEVLSLIDSLTTSHISAQMWQVLPTLFEMFKADGIDFFGDFMPVLHNYLRVDTDTFAADPARIIAYMDIVERVLTTDGCDDMTQAQAGKLLECVVLQLGAKRITPYIGRVLTLTLTRLTRKCDASELRVMMLQVFISCLYTDMNATLTVLRAMQPADSDQPLFDHLLKQWLDDTDCFLGVHDRKLSVLGLCTLMTTAANERPTALSTLAEQLVPNCLLLLQGLTRAYQDQAEMRNDDSEEEEDDDSDGGADGKGDALASDEDEIDEATLDYLDAINKSDRDSGNDPGSCVPDEDDDDDESWDGETDLEAFETPIDAPTSDDEEDEDGVADTSLTQRVMRRALRGNVVDEFVLFRNVMQHLANTEPGWHAALVHKLSEQQLLDMGKIYANAEQREQYAKSKAIAGMGGYQFDTQQSVPQTFNFGA